jgi:hypothetical protein
MWFGRSSEHDAIIAIESRAAESAALVPSSLAGEIPAKPGDEAFDRKSSQRRSSNARKDIKVLAQ